MLLEDAKRIIFNYKYALIYYISDINLLKSDSISEIYWDQLVEAYFFDENGQIHFYSDGDELRAAVFNESGDYIEKMVPLQKKYGELGKYLIVREYLKQDEDGQTYLANKVLSGIK